MISNSRFFYSITIYLILVTLLLIFTTHFDFKTFSIKKSTTFLKEKTMLEKLFSSEIIFIAFAPFAFLIATMLTKKNDKNI